MKKLIIFFILFLLTSCIPRKNMEYVFRSNYAIVKVKFTKIETKNGIHIFHFKNDSIDGVFVKDVDYKFINKNFQKIKLNKKYTVILPKNLPDPHRIRLGGMTINNIKVWDDSMNSEFFEDCLNVTGNQINPRFTLLKYIDPTPPKY